jgi:hypothetical protein
VATKYTHIAREFFADKGVHVDLIKLYGSMELAPLTGLADAIVDLVSTGNTLKANHWSRSSASWTSARAWWSTRPRSSSSASRSAHHRRLCRRHGRAQKAADDLPAHCPCACPPPTRFRGQFQRRCTGRPTPTTRSSSAWPTSWPTCARAATPRCWSTPRASTACRPPAWPRWS